MTTLKTGQEILAEAIVNMYHLSRHDRDEVLRVVQNHWPDEERRHNAETALMLYSDKRNWNGLVVVTPVQVGDDEYDWQPDEGETAREHFKKYEDKE